ncbi:cobalamin B12-binding domain-containing protein [Candidatus Micrarchaeota archaeon]|nr:cobalamin B12-binding domain-containing protein [Candidatus Micrarchaeota archaeon]MBU1939573.1 cobalamin B12-binding domain-containing protein [Candidatus Micrarchaeota archaeon]
MKILCVKEPVVGITEKGTDNYMMPLRTNMLPVSLLAVAGHLKERLPGAEIRMLDLPNNGNERMLQKEIEYGKRTLQRFFQGAEIGNYKRDIRQSECVLMSCNQAVQSESVIYTAKKIRAINPKAKLICGGQEVTRNPRAFASFDLAYVGADLEKLSASLCNGSKGIIDAGFGNSQFPALDIEFIGKGLNSYTTGTEGPLSQEIDGVVLPLKMSAGCGINCRSCRYPYKKCPLVFQPDKVIKYLKNAGEYCRVVLITDEITNLPQGKVVEVISAARKMGFFIDYANTIDLAVVSEYNVESIKTLFGNDGNSGCIGMCTYFTLKVLQNREHRKKVFNGIEKIISHGAKRASVNFAVGRHGTAKDIKKAFSEVFQPMKQIMQGRIGFLFNIYHTPSPYFTLHKNPALGNIVIEKLEKINKGPLVDKNTGEYRYSFPVC